jgi:type I restriction enzyme S subunit
MRTYEKYIDSGIDWVGLVPSNWRQTQLKYISSISKGRKAKEDFQDFKEGMITYLSMEYLRSQTESPSFVFADDPNIILVEEQDLLILWDGSKAGEIVKAKQGALSSTMGKIHVESDLFDLNFLTYYLKNAERYIQANTVGMGIPHVSGEVLRTLYVIFPKKEEQAQIAQYLDHQTAIIDQLIQQKEKLIELLKEKRQAVINEAVTKGLNPNTKMKDSGIEWLGEVPENWKVLKFRYLIDVLTDFTANGSFADLAKNVTYLDEGYSRLIRLTDLRENLMNDGIYVSEESHNYLTKSSLYGHEVLLANVGAYAGLAWKVPILTEPSTLGPNMFLLKFYNDLNNDFAYFSLISEYLSSQLKMKAISSAQPKLNKEDVRSCLFVLPTLEEQNQIVEYLLNVNQKFDDVLLQEAILIDKLKEYRQSIISEAVTGKIDVRDWQPNKQQVA